MGIIVFGIGNTLREDDGVGFLATQRLQSHFENVKFESTHQLLPEHAQMLSEHDHAIFIDVENGEFDGKINIKEIFPHDEYRVGIVNHKSSPEALLGLSLDIYEKAPSSSFVISIKSTAFGYKDTISTDMEAIFPKLLDKSMELINSLLKD